MKINEVITRKDRDDWSGHKKYNQILSDDSILYVVVSSYFSGDGVDEDEHNAIIQLIRQNPKLKLTVEDNYSQWNDEWIDSDYWRSIGSPYVETKENYEDVLDPIFDPDDGQPNPELVDINKLMSALADDEQQAIDMLPSDASDY